METLLGYFKIINDYIAGSGFVELVTRFFPFIVLGLGIYLYMSGRSIHNEEINNEMAEIEES